MSPFSSETTLINELVNINGMNTAAGKHSKNNLNRGIDLFLESIMLRIKTNNGNGKPLAKITFGSQTLICNGFSLAAIAKEKDHKNKQKQLNPKIKWTLLRADLRTTVMPNKNIALATTNKTQLKEGKGTKIIVHTYNHA